MLRHDPSFKWWKACKKAPAAPAQSAAPTVHQATAPEESSHAPIYHMAEKLVDVYRDEPDWVVTCIKEDDNDPWVMVGCEALAAMSACAADRAQAPPDGTSVACKYNPYQCAWRPTSAPYQMQTLSPSQEWPQDIPDGACLHFWGDLKAIGHTSIKGSTAGGDTRIAQASADLSPAASQKLDTILQDGFNLTQKLDTIRQDGFNLTQVLGAAIYSPSQSTKSPRQYPTYPTADSRASFVLPDDGSGWTCTKYNMAKVPGTSQYITGTDPYLSVAQPRSFKQRGECGATSGSSCTTDTDCCSTLVCKSGSCQTPGTCKLKPSINHAFRAVGAFCNMATPDQCAPGGAYSVWCDWITS